MSRNRKTRGNEYTSFIYGSAFVISSFIIIPLINHLITLSLVSSIARVLGVWAGVFIVASVFVATLCMRFDAKDKRTTRRK